MKKDKERTCRIRHKWTAWTPDYVMNRKSTAFDFWMYRTCVRCGRMQNKNKKVIINL